LAEPTRDILIRSLGKNLGLLPGDIASVELLGSSEAPTWDRRPDGLLIQLPAQLPSSHAVVFKVTPV
jgi:alpha-L-fucosidase